MGPLGVLCCDLCFQTGCKRRQGSPDEARSGPTFSVYDTRL